MGILICFVLTLLETRIIYFTDCFAYFTITSYLYNLLYRHYFHDYHLYYLLFSAFLFIIIHYHCRYFMVTWLCRVKLLKSGKIIKITYGRVIGHPPKTQLKSSR